MKQKFLQIFQTKFARLIWFFGLILIFLMGLSIIRNIGRVARIRAEVEKERQKIAKIRNENEELQKQISQTQGVEFIEKELRNKLGLVKVGETIVVLPDEETLKKLAPKAYEEEEILPDPTWKRWLKLFI